MNVFRKFVLLVGLLLLSPVTGGCWQQTPATRVLFVGNSYTYFNNLPRLLAQLAASAKPSKAVDAEMVVEGGATLQKLWDEGKAVKAIREKRWDYVVLQEQSTLGEAGTIDGIAQINDPAAFFKAARLFNGQIRKTGAKTVFYMTWARENSAKSQEKLTFAYLTIANELNAMVAPVGIAWQAELANTSTLHLYQSDKSHPTPGGSYLAACVFYAVLFGQSPVGLTNRIAGKPVDIEGHVLTTEREGLFPSANDVELVNLQKRDARALQRIAWHAAQGGKSSSPTNAGTNDRK
jgi:uncharacterized protein DUF4886